MKYKVVLESLPLPTDYLEKISNATTENLEGKSMPKPSKQKIEEEVFFETDNENEISDIIKKLIWQRAKNGHGDFVVKKLFKIDQKDHKIPVKFSLKKVQPVYYLVLVELMREHALGQKKDGGLVMHGAFQSGWLEMRLRVSDDDPEKEKKFAYYINQIVISFLSQKVFSWDVKRIFKFKNGQRTEIMGDHPIRSQFKELQDKLNEFLAKN